MVVIVPGLIFSLLVLYPVFIVFQRAGLNTSLAYLVMIPFVGWLIVTIILGSSDWNIRQRTEADR